MGISQIVHSEVHKQVSECTPFASVEISQVKLFVVSPKWQEALKDQRLVSLLLKS